MGKALTLALTAVLLAGCDSAEEKVAQENQRAADSMAAARARGETDLGNPEMGSKVLLTVQDNAIEMSHEQIKNGQVSFAVQNRATDPRVVVIKGSNGRWQSIPMQKDGFVLMSMILVPGTYDIEITSTDSTKKNFKLTKQIRSL